MFDPHLARSVNELNDFLAASTAEHGHEAATICLILLSGDMLDPERQSTLANRLAPEVQM
jgi:hypothetical protein